MLLTLALIVQIYSTVRGYKEIGNNRIKVQLNETCVTYKEKVSKNFAVAKGCYMYCSSTGNTSVVKFPDERLCAVQLLQSGDYSPLSITGKCYNATCMRPEKAPVPTKSGQFCSPPETTLQEKENIATTCKHLCFDKSSPTLTYARKMYNVTNGLKCWDQRKRTVGTCQNGTCSGEYNEGECKRKMLAVYSRANVIENCTLKCDNGSYIQAENGTMCALRTPTRNLIWSWIWKAETFVEEIGVCHNGICVHREKYNAAKEDSTKGCQGTNIVINENLTVASPCTALCNDGTTTPRKEELLCLYEFYREKKHDIYNVGKCHCGICEPRDDYIVVTDRGNPNDYEEQEPPAC
uniref:Putative salivary kunitz domain protein n=1 Tax=Ixodes ricinus TaxID=34613 RepID=A0A6B0V9D2_IXORI